MSSIARTIRVSFEHRIFFTEHVFDTNNDLLRDLLCSAGPSKAIVVLDESLAMARPELIQSIQNYFTHSPRGPRLVCPPLIVEGGERAKNSFFHVTDIHSHVERYHMDRHSYIIAVGGGALLDVAGLAAATAHRGLRLVRVPTTTLAQNDSGVGVKNGVNAFGKKNFIGTFAPPFAVVNDFDFISSLPDRDKRAGCVEAIKVALIRDRVFFEKLERDASLLAQFDPEAMRQMIRRCAELHIEHICGGGDPFEFGTARPLDFGHWAAHKLEQLSEYQIRHGEAVAIGIAIDCIYSHKIGWLDSASVDRVLNLLEQLGFELFAPELLHQDHSHGLLVMQGLQEFREHLGGGLTITLLQGIGQGVETGEIDLKRMRESIEELKKRLQ